MKKGFGRAEAYGETEQQLTKKNWTEAYRETERKLAERLKLKLHIKNKTKTNIQ